MSKTISILSYNGHLFYDTPVGLFSPDQVYQDEQRQAALMDQLKAGSYDVIGLTEVWADSVQDGIMGQFKSWGRECFAYQDKPTASVKIGSGLVLSANGQMKPPPMAFQYYDTLVGADAWSLKGVAYGRVKIGEQKVMVIQTHTQATYVGSEKEDQAARDKGIRDTLYPILDTVLQDFGGPVFLLGDLNIIAGSEEYNAFAGQMRARGMVDAWTAFSQDPGYTYDPAANALVKRWDPRETQKQRLDYIFFREEKAKVEKMSILEWKTPEGTDVSDHYGVTASFSV